MRIKPVLGWTAVAATVIFSAGCLEQPAAKKTATTTTSKASGAVIQRGANDRLILAAAPVNTIPPKITTSVAPIHALAAHTDLTPNHVRGARIYDDFLTELDKKVTAENPLLTVAEGDKTGITKEKSYRCGYCHGFDYESSRFTWNGGGNSLLELRAARARTEDDVIALLSSGFTMWDGTKVVTAHNYSALLTPQAMVDVADFVVNEIFDTHVYISQAAKASLGSLADGEALYNSAASTTGVHPIVKMDGTNYNCVDCHGTDGKGLGAKTPADPTLKIDIAAEAWADPWKFLHRTLFGVPRSLTKYPGFTKEPSVMSGFYETVLTDGLFMGGPKQGAATLMYVQSLTPPAP